ncbi:hypothetical protein SERLA73DRAFT_191410 [Serpula lacrymans var. lacrymans S7.3]|uniref:Uncharacterized protein n=2 Tax=Serpula lacrymans var. lacrymans TaxID=341189 RepID=F8QHI3_SERL3|nr:uncharacterized protein SERLADRAFT_458644 [Serpula lacrymans var. lacrymans S7.9]EGN92223.1 hypothetical protein SERLA73DRAFT_191410 [Serpula lacrymans var. lacrymans S7.3]EGO28217.1 hypothetical protein SERLADRAFT_458644 [Serpula lacrymans var. lacrymans S7.9]
MLISAHSIYIAFWFADRNIFMRYHWGFAPGHVYTRDSQMLTKKQPNPTAAPVMNNDPADIILMVEPEETPPCQPIDLDNISLSGSDVDEVEEGPYNSDVLDFMESSGDSSKSDLDIIDADEIELDRIEDYIDMYSDDLAQDYGHFD